MLKKETISGKCRIGIFLVVSMLFFVFFSGFVFAADPVFIDPSTTTTFNITEDELFTYNITAIDSDGDYPINFTDTSHDAGIGFFCFNKKQFNGSITTINFTPTNEYVGFYSIDMIAKDSVDESDILTLKFNVSNSNDNPYVISAYPSQDVFLDENSTIFFNITIGDDDLIHGDNLSFAWFIDNETNPLLNSSKINSTFSKANFTPTFFHYRPYPYEVTVVVNDSSFGQINYTWNLTVNNVNREPVFSGIIENITWWEDTDLVNNITLADYFSDPDVNSSYCEPDTGNCLDFSRNLVSGDLSDINVDINDSTSNVSFYPSENWFGTLNITFSVTDGFDSAQSNDIMLEVINENDPPIISPIENQTTFVSSLFSYQVQATDPDFHTMTYYVDSPTLGGIDINSTTGLIEYEPLLADSGNHTINVTVADEFSLNSSVEFNLEIIGNSRPVIQDFGNISVMQFQTLDIQINATDADGDDLFFWMNSSLLSKNASDSTSANYTITPVDQSLVGNHSLRVYANDTKNSIDHYDFMLEIIDTPSPPNITSIAIENNMLKVNLSYSVYVYASDEDGNIVGFNDNTSLFNISTVDTGSYNTSAIGEISFTPDTIGYYEVNISVNDSTDLFDYFVLSFNVTENHPPVFTQISNITCEEDELCEYQVLADDPDWQDNITFGDNTTEFDIDSETGLISFIPPLNANYNVTLWVHDGTINTTEVIWVNITEINDPPVFTENITNISFWDNIFEEQFSEVHLNASDEENDSISLNVQFFNFTDLGNNVYTENISLFNFTRVVTNPDNTVTGTINFTPRSNQVGEYWVNISASDGNDTTSIVFNFTVQNQNDLPIFNWSMNYSYGGVFLQGNESDDYNYFNCQENRSVYFTVDAFDPDFDTINYTWYREKDGITSLFYHSIHGDYNYTIPFNASPQETIILSVYDGISSVNISWQLSAENVNRPIVFGKKHYDFIQGSGVYNGTKLTDGNLMLLNSSPSVFFSNGSFTSDYIDFRSSSYGIDRIDYRTISYDNSDNSSGYDVYVYTDTTRQATETPSFSLYDGEEISTEDYRYFWFKLQVNSTNNTATPVISGVDMTYDIHDLQVSANTQYAGWIDLDNFFIDPDKDDNVTYSHRFIQGANLVTVSYASGSYVGLDFNNAGTASLIFTATDEHNSSTDSNLITIEIQSDGEDSTDSTSTSTTSSGTSYRTRVETETIFEYKTKEEPVALDIIHPQEVTIYDDETIEIPITLQNNEKFDLMGLSINATSDRGNYPVTIDKSEIELLGRDQSSEILLKMNVSDIYDSFGVIVNVSVADPLYSDSAKIMVTSLKRASSDDNAETLKLSFVSDLLSKNEECAELSEYVDRAKHYIESEELDKASQTLDNFINDCKLLIKYSDNEEMITGNIMDRTIDKIKTSNEYLMLAVSIGVIFFITIVMSLVTIYRKI